MRRKNIIYLETNKFHRLIFEKDDVIEVYKYILNDFKEEARNSDIDRNKLSLEIQFSNTEDSKEFCLDLETYLNDNNKITELSEGIRNYIDREDFSEINISYRKLYNDKSITINIKNEEGIGFYPYAMLCIKSNNDEWVNSKIAGLNSIFKKTLKIDYSILRSLLIYLAFFYLILGTNLIDSMRSSSSLGDNIFYTSIISLFLLVGIFANLLSKFIRIKCFPRVEFSFGKKSKYYEGNRKLFYWALALTPPHLTSIIK